ncbi:MAG TPA: hypothetical protein VHQ90_11280 [Thermoanaerobaculia bacterium]|nr:hypothetical protein [Thermoanaerobaculia bacterium]
MSALKILAVTVGALLLAPATSRAGSATCGNAVLDPGEARDDGSRAGGDCCSPLCSLLERKDVHSSVLQWEELGPFTIGGRVTALALDPRDARRLFAGTPAGGVWRSDDGGLHWLGVATWLAGVPISALAVAPDDGAVVIAGTGGVTDGGTVSPGLGVIRSADGGASWAMAVTGEPPAYVAAILIWAEEPQRVLAATDRGILLSSDGGRTFQQARRGNAVSSLVRDPFDQNAVYASSRTGLLWSSDRGLSWSLRSSWPLLSTDAYGAGTTALSLSGLTPGLLYATVQVMATFDRTARSLLLRSSDGGRTFEEIPTAPPFCPAPDSCGFAQALLIDSGNDGRLLLGGDALYASTDRGETWTVLGTATGVHTLVPAPGRGYAAGASGVARIDAAWTTASPRNEGLAITSIVSLDASRQRPPRLLAGTADSGSILGQGEAPSWTVIFGGQKPAGTARFDPFVRERLYVSRSRGRFFRSDDGGGSFHSILQGLDTSQVTADPAPLEPSPLLPGTLFAGRLQLFRSDSAGDSWIPYRPPGNPEVYGIAPSPVHADRLYFSLTSGATLYKADGIFTEGLEISSAPSLRVTSILLDPKAENVLYTTLTDTAALTGRVFKSYDFGRHWEDVTPPGLPAANGIVKDPFGALYVATAAGVLRSANDGFTWSEFGTGLTGYGVTSLRMNGDLLFAGTSGRGVFRMQLKEWVSIDSIPPGGRFLVDGKLVTGPYLAVWLPGSAHRVEPYLVQTAGTHREFVSWSDGGAASHLVRVRGGNLSLTAAIREFHHLEVTARPQAGGALLAVPPSADGFYPSGTLVFLVAAPAPDQRLAGFGGDLNSAQDGLGVVVMNQPRSVEARFEPLVVNLYTDPPGLGLTIDGQTATAPASYRWSAGSRHLVAVPETVGPAPGDTSLLAFDGWSDLLGREHEVAVLRDTFLTDFTAHFIHTVTALEIAPGAARVLRTRGTRDTARIAALGVRPNPGGSAPEIIQVLRGTVDGELITELALAPAASREVIHSFVTAAGGARTRLVVYNPDPAEAVASLLLRNAAGVPLVARSDALRVPPGGQVVADLEDLLALPPDYEGLLTMIADRPLAASIQSVRSNLRPSTFLDPLLLVPFLDGDRGVPSDPRVQALVLTADTEHRLLLANPGSDALWGSLQILDETGVPLAVDSGAQPPPGYTLPAGGYLLLGLHFANAGGPGTKTAQVRITPGPGQNAPLVQLTEERVVGTSIAGPIALPRTVPPSRTVTHFLAPVDWTKRETGVVLTNRGAANQAVQLSLRGLDGVELAAATVAVPGAGQVVVWARQTFPQLPDSSRGVLLGTCSAPLEAVGLFWKANGRGEDIVAGFPLLDGAATPAPQPWNLPFTVDGDSWSAEWWFFNPSPAASTVPLAFSGPQGERRYLPMEVP